MINKNPTLEELNKIMEESGGYLNLENTAITSLPDNLTVGGNLYLRNTSITSLPDNLTVGGGLDLSNTAITNKNNYKKLKNGDYVKGKYLYADGILRHIKDEKHINEYIYYVGKIKNKNVVSDGTNFVHCSNFKDGIRDLEFKKCQNRGIEQYKNITLDSLVDTTFYRILTGACEQGTKEFCERNNLKYSDKLKLSKVIEITKGEYGHDQLIYNLKKLEVINND